MKVTILIFFLLLFSVSKSQNNSIDSLPLSTRVDQIAKEFRQNRELTYPKVNRLLIEARRTKDLPSQLLLLDLKTHYFLINNELDSLVIVSEKLQTLSKDNDAVYTLAMSYIYLAEAFTANGLYEKSLQNLKAAKNIVDTNVENFKNERKYFVVRANVYNSFANYYSGIGENHKAIEMVKYVIDIHNKIDDDSVRGELQYLNYSNLATLFVKQNADSAKIYAQKSIEIKPEKYGEDKVARMNYYVIGYYHQKNGEYKKALEFYKKSVAIGKETGERSNTLDIYENIIASYKSLELNDSLEVYQKKLDKLEKEILNSKYKSLREVVNKQDKNQGSNRIWIYISCLFAIILIFFISLIFSRRNKKINDAESNLEEVFGYLVTLAKKEDPSFILVFENTFPDFSKKLLSINKKLSKSEIEFCALLKLNLSTKEIAKISYLEIRTVQNKKYRIRKRLKISGKTDIYNWFNNL